MTLIDYHHGKMGNPLSFTIAFPMISSSAPSPIKFGDRARCAAEGFLPIGEKKQRKTQSLGEKKRGNYKVGPPR